LYVFPRNENVEKVEKLLKRLKYDGKRVIERIEKEDEDDLSTPPLSFPLPCTIFDLFVYYFDCFR